MIEKCLQDPALEEIDARHLARCWRSHEIAAGTLDPVPPAEPDAPTTQSSRPLVRP
jgi:hypothetical protein